MAVSNNWRNLRSFLRTVYNRRVNEWFRDVDDPLPDNSTARRQAKRACLILPNESQNMANIKMRVFYTIVQQVHLQQNYYGSPIEEVQERSTFRPQVHLFFRQDPSGVPSGRRAVEGQVSFRLINETSATMTEVRARQLAVRIRNEFALNGGFIWRKGNNKYTYNDLENRLDLRILSTSETEGRRVIDKVLDVLQLTYNNDFLQEIAPKRNSETSPVGTNLVFGRQRRRQRWRPTANVRFRYATLTVHGLQNRIVLVDRTKTYIRAYEFV